MIFIQEKYLPNFLKKNKGIRVLVGIFLIFFLFVFVYWQIKRTEQNIIRGPDLYNELKIPITYNLFDSLATGLYKYRVQFGHFPQIEGKYFFDSIKPYTNISYIYIYSDSITKKPLNKNSNYLTKNHTFIGIGNKELTIMYKPISPDSFLLYSIGKNLIDESGKGDDIVFRKNR